MRSQAARGLHNDVTPEMIMEKKPASRKAQQLAKDLAVAKKQGLPIPTITVGRQVAIPPIFDEDWSGKSRV